MNLGLDSRVALVTGASRGIGKATALALAAERCAVAITYRNRRDEAERLVARIRDSGGRADAYAFDLSAGSAAQNLVGAVVKRWNGLHILINNAVCWSDIATERFEEVNEERWLPALRANNEGLYRMCQAAVRPMRASRWGRIVNVSATFAVDGFPGAAGYSMAKAGMHGLTRTLAVELGRSGILVNSVMPGLTMTERAHQVMSEETADAVAAGTPLGRNLDSEDLARFIVFLASAANTSVTGEVVRASGGARAQPVWR